MTIEELDDAALVDRTRQGDADAYGLLVRRYLRRALAVAWELAGTREDAEDIVQDAFHRALVALPRFDVERPFAPWFFTILRNVARSAGARAARWNSAATPDELPASAADPLAELERDELHTQLRIGLERLPERQRACVRLCDLEGFSGPEVAAMLGLSEGTVRTHLFRARRALRSSLRSLTEGRNR